MTSPQQAAEVQRAIDARLIPLVPQPEVIDLPPSLGWAMWDAAVKAQDKGQ